MKRSQIGIISLIVFVNMLGYGIVLPILPYYVETLGAGPVVIGLISSTYSLFQLIAAPLLGEMSDKWGRRPVLLFSVAGTAISFFLMGVSNTILLLFIARMIDGISGGNISTAHAYIADKTTKQERTAAMGKMMVGFNLGLFLGPALGGILSRFGYSVPLIAAGVVSTIAFVLTYFFLPESLTKTTAKPVAQVKKLKNISLKSFVISFRRPEIGTILMISFLVMLAYSLLQGTLALFSEHVLGLSSTMNGVIFAYLALVGIVAQMFAFKKILSWMSEKRAVIMAMVAMALGFILITFGLGLWTLIVAITLLGFGYSISGPMIVGWLSKRTADNEQGGTAGLNQSMTSIARLVGPVFGTSMYQHLGFKSPYYVASGILLITAMFQLLRFKPGLWHNVAVRSQDLVNK